MPRETDVDDILERAQLDLPVRTLSASSLSAWLTSGSSKQLTSGKVQLVSNVIDKFVDIQGDTIRGLADKSDFAALKRLAFEDSNLSDQLANITFNAAMTEMRDLRDAENIQGLINLKRRIEGIEFEDEVNIDLDKVIERLRGKEE